MQPQNQLNLNEVVKNFPFIELKNYKDEDDFNEKIAEYLKIQQYMETQYNKN
jgi:hypothetical protein